MLQRLFTKQSAKITFYSLLSVFLLFSSLNIFSTFSQETPPATEEPLPLPTEVPTELPSPTATFTDLPTSTATNTETPLLTPTETATETAAAPTETPLEMATETETATLTLTATNTETLSATPTLTPSVTATSTSDRMPTPGTPNYEAVLQKAQVQGNQMQLLDPEDCDISDINSSQSIVAAPPNGNPGDLYAAIAKAHLSGSASPYPIYLCPGDFPLSQTAVLSVDINFYGSGMDVSTIYQAERDIDDMGGMFTLNDNIVEFNDVTVKDGQALSVLYGATVGGAIKIYSGTLNINDSKFENNHAYEGGAIAWGDDTTISRSVFVNNTAEVSGGALNVDDVIAACTRFITNQAVTDVGGAIAVDGGGIIYSSAFTGNIASSDGDHIYNFDSETSMSAEFNWWGGSAPLVPDDVSSGVDADPDADHDHTIDKECLTLEDFGIVWEGDWSNGELEQILIGAVETGKALYAHGVVADSLVEAFRIVMEGLNGTEYRQIRFVKDTLSGTYCTTTPNPNSDFSAYIACDDDIAMTQYTTTHEFGHVFLWIDQIENAAFVGTRYIVSA